MNFANIVDFKSAGKIGMGCSNKTQYQNIMSMSSHKLSFKDGLWDNHCVGYSLVKPIYSHVFQK